jgi:hypothetical protein
MMRAAVWFFVAAVWMLVFALATVLTAGVGGIILVVLTIAYWKKVRNVLSQPV